MTLVARPNYLANRAVAFDDFIGGLGIAQPPRISLKDDRFTLLDETGMTIAEPTLSLDVVIVSANKNASRQYYDPSKPYDPTNSEGPLCWSDNGVGPSKACASPQAPTCGACPNAAWGSAVSKMTGKPVPACSTRKKLAVLVGGQDGMFLLVVPPDSLGSLKQYMSSLAKMPASPEELVTRIKMENKQLVFEAVDWVPENFMAYIAEKIESDDAASIVNRHDEARDPAEFNKLTQVGAPAPQLRQSTPEVAQQPAQIEPPRAEAPRRGRPPKAASAPPSFAPPPAPPAPIPVQQPAYTSQQQQQTASQPVAAPPGFGFGMQSQPQAPDPGVQGMLDRAFSLPRRA